MLHGSLLDKIILFALPLAASSVLQQLFNSVDIAVVGQFAGKEAMAAVGSNSSVINLVITLFVPTISVKRTVWALSGLSTPLRQWPSLAVPFCWCWA